MEDKSVSNRIAPKVLVISNECLSKSGSNGRTLKNFLLGWPKESLAQFYIQNNAPDFEVCSNYYKITDYQALNAFWGKARDGRIVNCETENSVVSVSGQVGKPHRNALTMLARELVWGSKRWMTPEFKAWVRDFSPELILLQAGDCAFMFKLASSLAKEYQIPLVIYNSEGYYFKKYDYFRGNGIAHCCYPIFHRYFCKIFKEVLNQTKLSIYICESLQRDYDTEFGLPSVTVHTATEVKEKQTVSNNKEFTASYLGNLGVGRHEPLIEIAETLQRISPNYFLDIYGKIPNESVETAFAKCAGIRYKGFVSYDQVVRIMHESDLLVHAENFGNFYQKDLKYAFSTKIADSLASGTCFMLYAPESMACSQYLLENEAAYVVTKRADLDETLRNIVKDVDSREKFLENAKHLVYQNHNAEINAEKFQDHLRKAVER